MIIGLTGTLGAGKGTVAEYLIKKGFSHFSVRAFLIEEIKKRGLEVNRDNMVSIANELRERFGPACIVLELYKRAKENGGNCIIESIRCPGEAEALREKKDFYLFAIDGDAEIRYERILKRGSETDDISFKIFIENEKREMSSADPFKQNLAKCIFMSDYIIINNQTIEELYEKLENSIMLIDEEGRLKRRPTFDEIYMANAYNWAAKSTCLRRHVGAIIAMDNTEISQGYNGAPRGSKHCSELGCERQKQNIPSGERSEICRGVHAEENAILNAARTGRSVIGATLYVTTSSCAICARSIINSGISRAVYNAFYGDSFSFNIFKNSAVKVERYEGVMPHAFPKFFNIGGLV